MGRPISDHLPSRQPGEPRPEEKKVIEEPRPEEKKVIEEKKETVIADKERYEPPKNIEDIVRTSVPLENKIMTRETEEPSFIKKKKRR
jgi:hypothetical protein